VKQKHGFDIIMYHYVRDLAASRYPNIKGLDVHKFIYQLDYLLNTRQILEPAQVREIVEAGEPFPENSCWLTFDDGYVDHFDVVFPLLEERGLKGSFFPPVLTTSRQDVLDVNKIHFILAAVPDAGEIVEQLRGLFDAHHVAEKTGTSFSDHLAAIDTASRYDSPDVIRIKRLLQRDFPSNVRTLFSDELFQRYVSHDVPAFADELYMSVNQLREMQEAGHEIGVHGDHHNWLGSMCAEEQRNDIAAAVGFFRDESLLPAGWTMCYPYGSYNTDTLEIVSSLGCVVGITTLAERVPTSGYTSLELPRLDTNDFPQG